MAHHPAEYGTLLVAALLSPRQTLLSTSDESEPPFSPEDPQGHKDSEISDQEWEIRTGRATYILQQTLPDFFATGLVSSTDVRPDPPAAVSPPKRRMWTFPGAIWLGLRPKPSVNTSTSVRAKTKDGGADGESIYGPRIKLTYTPPTPLPAPFPKTLAFEGLHLYIASSIFVRHTLNALYMDLAVTLRRGHFLLVSRP
ncbi:uncharacterized protein PHACADRAFT_197569 [Phanerochaete carnosa HHB-10118-sp]|uniref:Uncharacterized protein n=1 Tax=Phanerochaete carnosa (strain HHB-10118-sp) TaxID=650164 RepID=K5W2J7_PHACS|nr:uncharacterized protein PHACADRAFT_197569 [Phanerochaete carnosa HHB-10118-sp]EKM53144.1 hypothetical protein PHACADRAFT_197569 [Phanerochaete carnosa HHB-10118-sp]